MRLFIAINFPDETRAAIAKIRDNLKASAFRGNFTFDENLHLTLVFLGECDAQQTETIKAIMSGSVFSEFTLELEKVGYFKRNGGNTWWVGLKENSAFSALQANLSKRLKQKGFMIEDRKYSPHVTIGREVKMQAGFMLLEVPQVSFSVQSIDLMRSERINGKLTYTIL